MKIVTNIILTVAIILSFKLNAQSNFQDFLSRVNSIPDSVSRSIVVDSFTTFARTQGIPYIEGNTANFLFRGIANTVNIAGDFNGWNSSSITMNRISLTNFFYYSRTFETNARLDYKFVTNGGTWILDPENPNRVAGGFGPNSELAMPQYVQPWEIKYKSNIKHGTLITKSIYSTIAAANYQISVYLPFGYDTLKSYPSVYFQDGSEYISLGSALNVIDNLVDSSKIENVIAVFVTPNNRNDEYAGSKRDQYRLFFANELVPYIDSTYKTIKNPDSRLVMGDSFGGNISALISYYHSDVFGNCGLHSGAFWPNNYEAYNFIVNNPIKNIKFNSVWGTYESLFTNMRNFRDSLQSKGYQQKSLELPEGHSWGLWRATIDEMLTFFFPKAATNVEEETGTADQFELFQNYPNPFNPTTKIKYSIPSNLPNGKAGVKREMSNVVLKVYDMLGSEVKILVNEEKQAGEYEVEFNAGSLSSGVYLYRLNVNAFVRIMKMIVVK